MGVRSVLDIFDIFDILDVLALAIGYGVLFFTVVALAAVVTMAVHDAVLAHRRVVREIDALLFESHRYDRWARTHTRGPRRRRRDA